MPTRDGEIRVIRSAPAGELIVDLPRGGGCTVKEESWPTT